MVEFMGADVLCSMEEYLQTAYSPDREYVDGVVVERHVGERGHSIVQRNVTVAIDRKYPHLFVFPEWRARTSGRRCRIPDVCVTLDDPGTDVLESPPFLAIEVLSRRDEMSDVLEKLAEYIAAGVQYVWVIDPRRKKAFTYTGHQLQEVEGEELVTGSPEIRLSFAEIFRGL
jgi:Uma2 family endonuclease